MVTGDAHPIRWEFTKDEQESILNFEYRSRLSAFTKNLLDLPCMSGRDKDDVRTDFTGCPHFDIVEYSGLKNATLEDKRRMKEAQEQRLDLKPTADDSLDIAEAELSIDTSAGNKGPVQASFVTQTLFEKPSQFIADKINRLSATDQALTRDQCLFMARFAKRVRRGVGGGEARKATSRTPRTSLTPLGPGWLG